jgi:hypothetical protein
MCFPMAQLILALIFFYKNPLEHIEWVECIFEGGPWVLELGYLLIKWNNWHWACR